MKILSKAIQGKRKQMIVVHTDKPTVVKFFTPNNYQRYKKGLTHRYWGGYVETPPAQFEIPRKGVYYAVVEKGSFNNPVELTARVELTPPKFDYLNVDPENETHTDVEVDYDDTLE